MPDVAIRYPRRQVLHTHPLVFLFVRRPRGRHFLIIRTRPLRTTCRSACSTKLPDAVSKKPISAFRQLFDIFRQESPVEVVADGVIHESLLCLWFRPGLPFEDHVIVPSVSTN